MEFKESFKTKWADFDPNNHLRHSAYNDYAAECRVRFFHNYGLSLAQFNALHIGPILFQENTNFYREISIGENITVELLLKGTSENGERFKFTHQIYKENGVLSATIEVYGAWLDLEKRKLTTPPKKIIDIFKQLNKTENFEIIPIKKAVSAEI